MSAHRYSAIVFVGLVISHFGRGDLQCWKCASVNKHNCPNDATLIPISSDFNSCVTWKLGNGTVILQNVVKYEEECTRTKIEFWSRFINLYYGGNEIRSGTVECCKSSGCNDGKLTSTMLDDMEHLPQNYPGPALLMHTIGLSTTTPLPPSIIQRSYAPNVLHQNYPPQYMQRHIFKKFFKPYAFSAPFDNYLHLPAQDPVEETGHRVKTCREHFTSHSSGEWLPETLFPLTYDRASKAKVGIFHARFVGLTKSNHHIVVRIVDKSKKNDTMYTFKLYNVGSVSLFISELKPRKGGSTYSEEEKRKTFINNALDLSDDKFSGFWVSIRGNELAFGRVGDKIVNPILVWNDTNFEGPREPFFIGLTTPESTSASFGANCEAENFHFDDTCIADRDCSKYPQTICRSLPIDSHFDQGGRDIPFDEWDPRSSILKSCFCREGHKRIPDSKGCYDPIRSVVTLKDACFSNHHCDSLPNTACKLDEIIPYYNKSCQCLMGYKPFNSDPKTGLIEGCAKLTEKEKMSVLGCNEKFVVKAAERVPTKVLEINYDEDLEAYVAAFHIKFDIKNGKNKKNSKSYSDIAVIRLLNRYKSSSKMLSVTFDRTKGRIAIKDTRRTRGFFFNDDITSERAGINDEMKTSLMTKQYIGFWITYSYKESLGGTLSVGLVGAPISIEHALLSWTDSSDRAIKTPAYLGFTAQNEGSTIQYGASCVVRKNPSKPSVVPQSLASTQNDLIMNSVARMNPSVLNPWINLPEPHSFLNDESIQWQNPSSPDPFQYISKLQNIYPDYSDDPEAIHPQSLMRDVTPLSKTLSD